LINFRNLSVQRSFWQYKSQCLEKVNVKYVIKRLWHEIFHIVPGINPRPISVLQLHCRTWYGGLGLIPGPIWKMACNLLIMLPNTGYTWTEGIATHLIFIYDFIIIRNMWLNVFCSRRAYNIENMVDIKN
jgi:hypothetical protein